MQVCVLRTQILHGLWWNIQHLASVRNALEQCKDIFQQEGHSWPLNFQRFTLYMNENYETLLDTGAQNPTAPWICTEELWIGRPRGNDMSYSIVITHVLLLCAHFCINFAHLFHGFDITRHGPPTRCCWSGGID